MSKLNKCKHVVSANSKKKDFIINNIVFLSVNNKLKSSLFFLIAFIL